MSKETSVKMNPHWGAKADAEITITNEPLMTELPKAVTLAEGSKADKSFMGNNVKTEYIGYGVLALLVLIVGYRWCAGTLGKPVRRDSKGRRL